MLPSSSLRPGSAIIGAGAASLNEAVVNLVRAHHDEDRWVVGNCAGLSVLHRAGILEGSEVTAPATVSRRLQQRGEKVADPQRAWRIDAARKLMTIGGAGTVHPNTIALVWHLFGEEDARDLAATWDTRPPHGESLFALDGPALNDDAAPRPSCRTTGKAHSSPARGRSPTWRRVGDLAEPRAGGADRRAGPRGRVAVQHSHCSGGGTLTAFPARRQAHRPHEGVHPQGSGPTGPTIHRPPHGRAGHRGRPRLEAEHFQARTPGATSGRGLPGAGGVRPCAAGRQAAPAPPP
ncbi:DJ-1/PfpI family protein [Streptomyces sp. NPDC005195]|uniref:DJ-1/PfpI family protein n=1 Tax=Streptomyces sp. NPDC005195 TaxID=3154561 RepID=UPI0033A04020